MSNLTKFQDAAVENAVEVKGGFFFLNSYASKSTYCAPKPTYCAPAPTHCGTGTYCAPAPKPTYCAPTLPKISFSFGFGGGCW